MCVSINLIPKVFPWLKIIFGLSNCFQNICPGKNYTTMFFNVSKYLCWIWTLSHYLYLILELLDEVLFKEIREVWRFFRNFLSTFIRSSFNTILFSSFCKQILLVDIYTWGISCVVLQVARNKIWDYLHRLT